MEEGIVIYHGFLKKSPPEHRLMRSWQRRFFVLRSNKKLFYYKSEKDKKPVKDPIDLHTCRCVEANLQHNKFPYVFSVNTVNRTYYMVADSQEIMDTWVEKLCFVCGFERQDESSPGTRSRPTVPIESPAKAAANSYTLSHPSTCPLSAPPDQQGSCKERSHSDPQDPQEIIRRATSQYNANLQRRKSTQCVKESVPKRLGNSPSGLPKVSEGYDSLPNPVPLEERNSWYDDVPPPRTVSPASAQRPPRHRMENYDIVVPHRKSQELAISPMTNYDIVPPTHRPASENYDIVPLRKRESDPSDLYDVPPYLSEDFEQETYDSVPRRSLSTSLNNAEIYDVVPQRKITPDGSPSECYDIVPPPRPKKPSSPQDLYDIVPPPRPESDDIYDIAPPAKQMLSDDVYDTPPSASEISQRVYQKDARCPIAAAPDRALEAYDQIPPPRPKKSPDSGSSNLNASLSSQCSLNDQFDRDSGSFNDDIYDIPPKPGAELYDVLPGKSDDIYDIPPGFTPTPKADTAPAVDRSVKPPTVDRLTKPPVNRTLKPSMDMSVPNVHPYENLGPDRVSLGLAASCDRIRKQESYDKCYTDMQPCRSDSTRCYSFSKEQSRDDECYEDMQPILESIPKRESGVHSNSSSSDGEEDKDIVARNNRRAALQYCEVQIVEGSSQTRLQAPASQRNASSHYTTINEESTKAFQQTCSARKECLDHI
ncbi:predicted protein [Nematostella vectensis]|uniref:PH domain-containing protein n=1 Tax=Nematostella vectensis TaxID=45351 RepID=A7RVJ5_NEMVE|nr:GRB2-associated-binding protein 1 [Nematostella vectensis]EDO44466.1 predicted protein [Nematostella vectensis]|eukprot:XP_001636529.1 predicted protein [Nematostella vectensis]